MLDTFHTTVTAKVIEIMLLEFGLQGRTSVAD